MAKGRKVRASRAAQGKVEFSHFPPAVHFDLIRKQAVVIPALSRYFFDSSEISESVNYCVMEAIKLCRLDTPIIFIEAGINLSRFVVTGGAAKTSATVTFPSLNLISLVAFCFNIWLNGVAFFFSSRRRHKIWPRDWSSDECSSDLIPGHLSIQEITHSRGAPEIGGPVRN